MSIELNDPRLPANYWSKVRPVSSGCWEWTGARKARGYGMLGRRGRALLAHRVMFEAVHGSLPAVVRHSCDNPPCVNPRHLLGGTHKDNSADAVARGRQAVGVDTNHAALTDELVLEILRLKNTNRAERDVAVLYGVSQGHIAAIWRGKMWKHLHQDPVVAAIVAEPVRRKRPTHCKWGHKFTPENTRMVHNGTRRCRACQRQRDARKVA